MFFKLAIRNLRRAKLYAVLSIAGFALGIASCLLLGVYLWGELTYDRHHVNHERIYRVVQRVTFDGQESGFAQTAAVLGPMLAEDRPDAVEQYVRFYRPGRQRSLLRSADAVDYWSDTFVADDNVFDVFTHEVVYGDPRTALTDPSSIAISRRVAERYFGTGNPLGRTLTNVLGNAFRVTLVFENLPENTHLKYDALFAMRGIFAAPDDVNARRQMLNGLNTFTYVVLREGHEPSDWGALSAQFFARHMAEGRPPNMAWESRLQPLADIHLDSGFLNDRPTANAAYLYAFAAVGLSLLLITCINYVNLATARAAQRAKTIGLRKILGADRPALMAHLLGESVLFGLLATALGVIAVEVVIGLPFVTELFGTPLTLDLLGNPLLMAAIVGFGALVGWVAGLYPALYLSSFVPASAFSTRYQRRRGSRLRAALVFVQFTISVGVIASTLVITAQMRFIASQALGFEPENRIIVPLRGADVIERHEAIATELGRHAGVLGVTTSETMMGRGIFRDGTSSVEANDGSMRGFGFQDMGHVGADFVEVMGMRVVEGRDFAGTSGMEGARPVIVNEMFVREMGWGEPIGKQVGSGQNRFSGRVIGVVADFHFQSLHERIVPFAIFRGDGDYSGMNETQRATAERLMIVNVARDGLPDTLRYIEQRFKELDPVHPFELSFLDEELGRLYTSDERLLRMIGIFAAVCIFVACLGLFGLSAFTTEQRTKEIGIRKVCGASVAAIIVLLSRRTMLLIAAAGVAACVVAWNVMEQWLSGFAYRTDGNPGYFVVAIAVAAGAALATIALQSWRAACARPVEALRYE